VTTLILTRRIGERIMIGDHIVLTVLDADEVTESAKLGTSAPRDLAIQRQEARGPQTGVPAKVRPPRAPPRDPTKGWLVLERNVGEHIRIGHTVRLTVVGFDRTGAVRLGTDAPTTVGVHREEIYAKLQQQTAAATPQAPAVEPSVRPRRRRLSVESS